MSEITPMSAVSAECQRVSVITTTVMTAVMIAGNHVVKREVTVDAKETNVMTVGLPHEATAANAQPSFLMTTSLGTEYVIDE